MWVGGKLCFQLVQESDLHVGRGIAVLSVSIGEWLVCG